MSDFWQQVLEEEEQQWQEMLKNDPGYIKWLDQLNSQIANGGNRTINLPEEQK